jgi:hypothetical protein
MSFGDKQEFEVQSAELSWQSAMSYKEKTQAAYKNIK